MKINNFSKTQTIATMALLIALNVVLSRFLSISTPMAKIGFTFVVTFMSAVLLGPLKAGIVAALGDFIGAILFPIGTYFFGFTLTAFLVGLTWGLLVHKKLTFPRILIAVSINNLIFSLFLNTYWLHILFGVSLNVLGTTRLTQALILLPTELIVCFAISKYLKTENSPIKL